MGSQMFNKHHFITMLGQPEMQETASEKVTFGWSRAQTSLQMTL